MIWFMSVVYADSIMVLEPFSTGAAVENDRYINILRACTACAWEEYSPRLVCDDQSTDASFYV